jgi:hypothetical protein
MSTDKIIVITAYGHEQDVDKISVSTFDDNTDAEIYCRTINGLELTGNSWVKARAIKEKVTYQLDFLLKSRFDTIANFDDRAIQKIMREVDSLDLAKALKGANKDVQNKIFRNMSKRAASMLKEDMEYMGPISIKDVNKRKKKIINIIDHLEDMGEIQTYTGDMI